MAEQKKRGPGRPPGSKNKKSTSSAKASEPKTKQEHIQDIHAQLDKERRNVDVIWAITLFALGIFLLFTVVRDTTGELGMMMHDVCMGLFGIMAYALPFMFMLAAVLLLTRKLQHINGRTAFFSIMIFFMMCILNSGRFITEKTASFGFADIVKYYKLGVQGKKGGSVGMELGSLLVKGFGVPGLYIFAITFLIISVFLVANTPIARFFENMSKKRETRKLMAEIEAAEQAKVQMAVASTATPGADPDTGILPQMRRNRFEAVAYEPINIPEPVTIPDPVIIPEPVTTPDTVIIPEPVKFDEPMKAKAQSNNGFFGFLRKNTLFGTDPKNEKAGKYDSEDVGKDVAKETNKEADNGIHEKKGPSYGLGDPDDRGHSGSYGLGGYDRYDGNSGSGLGGDRHNGNNGLGDYDRHDENSGAGDHGRHDSRNGLSDTDASDRVADHASEAAAPKARPKRVIKSGIDDAAKAAAVAGTVHAAAESKKESDDSSDDMTESLNAALNASSLDSNYELPPVSLLKKGNAGKQMMSDYQLEEKADLLERTLKNFGVDATVLTVTQGASVTRYEVQPATGVKVSSITRLADDIALNLKAKSIRIEAPIPGKAAVGIEVENDKPAPVLVRDLIESEEFGNAKSRISFVVGKDISGNNIIADLKGMPHLLIAGATGSGKSVCINTIIASFLYKAKPSELKMIMIDPKVVELANYNGIPHMLTPVVTDARKASRALAIAVEEMDKRYELFAKHRVKDLVSYNECMRAENEPQNCKPEIVIIIDELADLMMASPSEVENSICRLAQKARAAGMHLIVATQRPSVDVVTGLIKANIPSRIAFSVSSQFDSRTILDMAGAEKLLGKGDMLFSPVGSNKPLRVQGPFISDAETEKLIKFVKSQGGDPVYDEELKNAIDNADKKSTSEPEDELTEDAIAFILKSKQASVSMLQRRFRIGYNRAARIIDEIEEKGIIGPADGSRPRQVLVTEDEYYGTAEDSVTEEETETVSDVHSDPEYEQIDAFNISENEASSGLTAFNSLPESVRKQILSTDTEEDN